MEGTLRASVCSPSMILQPPSYGGGGGWGPVVEISAMHLLTPGAPLALWLQQGGSQLQPFIPIILMVAIFYFVLFMPMRRKQRKLDEMLRNLKNGDKVVTTGGVIGTLVGVGDDKTVTMRVRPDNIKLQISRNAVTALVVDQEEAKP